MDDILTHQSWGALQGIAVSASSLPDVIMDFRGRKDTADFGRQVPDSPGKLVRLWHRIAFPDRRVQVGVLDDDRLRVVRGIAAENSLDQRRFQLGSA